MNQKLVKLLKLISENQSEIEAVVPADEEYFFTFRGRAFSVRVKDSDPTLYAYPKWQESLEKLAAYFASDEESEAGVYAYVDSSGIEGKDKALIRMLYDSLQARHLGLDELFSDLGID
jgi:hypothetical protein